MPAFLLSLTWGPKVCGHLSQCFLPDQSPIVPDVVELDQERTLGSGEVTQDPFSLMSLFSTVGTAKGDISAIAFIFFLSQWDPESRVL